MEKVSGPSSVARAAIGRGVALPIGPVGQDGFGRQAPRTGLGLRRDDQRNVLEARVVEDRRFEHRARVVGAAVQVRADLQRAVPELHAAVDAGRQQRAGQTVVADDPRRQRDAGAVRRAAAAPPTRRQREASPAVRMPASKSGTRIRFGRNCGARPDSSADQREPAPVVAAERHREGDERRHEDHRADGVGRLRRGVDRVEREQRRSAAPRATAVRRSIQVRAKREHQPRHCRVERRPARPAESSG